MSKLLGYTIFGADEDNRGMMEDFVPNEVDGYKNVYDINYLDPNYKMSSKCRKYDYVSTYDGYDIVSEKFKNFCEENKFEQIEFIKLEKEIGFYWMKAHNVVNFDAVKRKSEFVNYSEKYKAYWGVYGATPVFLKQEIVLTDGFYRTDLFFGDGHKKNPIILIGRETKEKIKKHHLKGVYFQEIVSS